MILEISKNKYPDRFIKEKVILEATNFFITNEDIFFKAERIKEIVGYSNIRMLINTLRNNGLSIISNHNGYKYTKDKEEIKECYKQLRERALVSLTAAKNMKKHI